MSTSARTVPWTVTYSDGSGNGFRFWQDKAAQPARFKYSPVTPLTSSSGTYSGGKPGEGALEVAFTDQLWKLVERLEADTSRHAKSRIKGTGALAVITAAGEREFLVQRTPQLEQLDQLVEPLRSLPIRSR